MVITLSGLLVLVFFLAIVGIVIMQQMITELPVFTRN